MIRGLHCIIYTRDPEADRAFFRDVLGFDSVDAGEGWLIFALPAAEAAFHPAEENDRHELYLVCDDLAATMERLSSLDVPCTDPVDQGWGVLTQVQLPGGGRLGLYEPRHPTAFP